MQVAGGDVLPYIKKLIDAQLLVKIKMVTLTTAAALANSRKYPLSAIFEVLLF
jgi:hypothetical protein